jgi:hypothetical protein
VSDELLHQVKEILSFPGIIAWVLSLNGVQRRYKHWWKK